MVNTLRSSTRAQAEEFLYEEAALLDQWRLDEWLSLFAPDAHYCVPSLDAPTASPAESLVLVNDDFTRLKSRVHQLTGRFAWAENPRSRTRRLVTNVRLLSEQDGVCEVRANFVVYRIQHEVVDTYIGAYEYTLLKHDDSFRIRRRKSILDLDALRPHGKLSFIL